MPKPKKSAEDIRKNITEMMAKAVSEGTPPWRKTWSHGPNHGMPCNFQSGRKYTGINPLILMFWSMIYGYESKFWGSYSAWANGTGGHVKKGQEATYITLFRMIQKLDPKTKKPMKTANGKEIKIPILREFAVFNVQQVEAPTAESLMSKSKADLLKMAEKYLPSKSQPKKSATIKEIAEAVSQGIQRNIDRYMPVEADMNNEPDFDPAEEFIKATGANIKYAGERAFYDVSGDSITVPSRRKFETIADFYETVFHELIHWTQKEDRVGVREQEDKTAGVQYAFNELVAEIGACLLLVELGVPLAEKMLENSASYVASWLKRMQSDTKFIFDAATQAGKAVDYLLSFIGRQNPVFEESEDESSDVAEREVA